MPQDPEIYFKFLCWSPLMILRAHRDVKLNIISIRIYSKQIDWTYIL